jgi:hypothetical protein
MQICNLAGSILLIVYILGHVWVYDNRIDPVLFIFTYIHHQVRLDYYRLHLRIPFAQSMIRYQKGMNDHRILYTFDSVVYQESISGNIIRS